MGASKLIVYTARVTYGGPDRLDITHASSGPEGRPFAPSLTILAPALDARRRARALPPDERRALEDAAWREYVPAFIAEMERSYTTQRAAWDSLLARERAVLCCYCTDHRRCHRTLVAALLVRLGATHLGELPAAEQAAVKRVA